MKKVLALILVVVMAMGVLAACGGEAATPTTTEAPTQAPTAAPTEAPTEAPADNVCVIDKISKHENGWAKGDQFGNTQFHGVYFNAKTNDAVYAEDWSVEYLPDDLGCVTLVRGGEEIDITVLGAGTIVKFSKNSYALKFEEWMIGEYFPIADGDMLILQGNFVDNQEGNWTISFPEPIYISFAGGMAKFANEDPRG